MKKHSSPPVAVTRLLRDVLLGPDRADRMRVSRLLGGAAHDIFLVRWAGEPLEGLNAVTVRLNRDGAGESYASGSNDSPRRGSDLGLPPGAGKLPGGECTGQASRCRKPRISSRVTNDSLALRTHAILG